MVEPSHRITFAGSPGKRRHGLIIAGLLAVVGVVALLSAGPGLPDGVMIGGLALALAAGFVFHVLRSTSGSGPIMTIDRQGVWFRDWGLPKVPWRHVAGIHVAGIRLHLIIRIDLIDGEAFLAGLIHDIGIMVEMQYDRSRLIEVVSDLGVDTQGVPSRCMLEVENEIFGASHQEFGKALCERWKFPRTFSMVTGHHHDPMSLPPDNRTLVCVVYLADRLVPLISDGFRLDLLNLDIDAAVRDELQLTNDKIEDLTEALPEHLKSVGDLLR